MNPNDFVAQLGTTIAEEFQKNQFLESTSHIGPWNNKPSRPRYFLEQIKQDKNICKSVELKKQKCSSASQPKHNRKFLKRKLRCQTSCSQVGKLPRILQAITPQKIEMHSVDKIGSKKQMRFPFICKKQQRDQNILNFLNKKKQQCINKNKYFFREVSLMLNNYIRKGHEYALKVGVGNLKHIVVPLEVRF